LLAVIFFVHKGRTPKCTNYLFTFPSNKIPTVEENRRNFTAPNFDDRHKTKITYILVKLIHSSFLSESVKTMRNIGPPKPWFKLETFCTKIHRSATSPIGEPL